MRRIYPVNIAQLPMFDQDIDIVYTDGKADPISSSPGLDQEASGFVVRAWVSPAKKCMEAVFVVDLQRCLMSSYRASLNLNAPATLNSPPDFDRFRLAVFEIVAHEYFHVVQEWILITKIGDPEALKKAYVAENRRNREKLLTDDLLWLFKPEPWKHAAYLRNRFEISAQKMAEAAKERLRTEVDRGLWDSILPVAEMRELTKRGRSR